MCGRFLRQLLAEESQHSTPVGRLLLPVLLGVRLVLLAASGPGIYGDDQREFVCHTQQPGCKVACYDAFHPLSPLRFWAFQVILLAVPSVLYLGFTLYHVIEHWEESEKVMKKEEILTHKGDGSRRVSAARSLKLLWVYVAQLGARLVLEAASLGGQYLLYGFNIPSSISCRQEPCIGSVTCNLSRPSEKTIFLKTMFGFTGLCLLVTLLELVLLGLGRWWMILKHKSSSPTSESTTRYKEPTDNFPVVETKEQFLEAVSIPIDWTIPTMDQDASTSPFYCLPFNFPT
nr:gap junction gamma-3 protein [Marmota flaviventris]